MRLGTYEFRPDGTVTARMWLWTQNRPVARGSTGVAPGDDCSTQSSSSASRVRRCAVPVPGGFAGAPNDVRTGRFTLSGSRGAQKLHIRWNNATRAWNEYHDVVENPDSGQPMALLRMTYNTAIARKADGSFHGGAFAYGSTRPFSERRHMSSVQKYRARSDFGLHSNMLGMTGSRIGNWTHQKFVPGGYRTCDRTTNCMTMVSTVQDNDDTGICGKPGCPNGRDRRLQNYVVKVANDRRDMIWHWCSCLAGARNEFCYTGNSHLKPMLQILDDNANFAGYVGVEVSFSVARSNPRASDMLGVIRIAEFR